MSWYVWVLIAAIAVNLITMVSVTSIGRRRTRSTGNERRYPRLKLVRSSSEDEYSVRMELREKKGS